MTRNVNPEDYYGWNREPENPCECGGQHNAEEHDALVAADDDADQERGE